MATTKSVPEGVQAVFPMLVCQNPEAEATFCAAAFGAIEQVRRPGPDGRPMQETTEGQRQRRWSTIRDTRGNS